MGSSDSPTDRERVEAALEKFLEADQYGNSLRYFRAADLRDIDTSLTSAVIGSYLPKLKDDSPLSSGLIVQEYTKRRGGPSLWLVRRNEK